MLRFLLVLPLLTCVFSRTELSKSFESQNDLTSLRILARDDDYTKSNNNKQFKLQIVADFQNSSFIFKSVDPGKPIAVLLHDKDPSEIREAYITHLINDLQARDFWLMKFNSSGVTSVLETTQGNKQNFQKIISGTNEATQYLGYGSPTNNRGGVVFFGILKATRILPRNSGIIVFTGGNVEDEDLAHLAIQEMLMKNITLFVVWESEFPSENHEEKIIMEAAALSGGSLLLGGEKLKLSNEQNDTTLAMSLILHRTNLRGEISLDFPVDSDAMFVQLILSANVLAKAKLTSPNGYAVDLLNMNGVEDFPDGSVYLEAASQSDLHVAIIRISKPTVGIWNLNLLANSTLVYNVTAYVQNEFLVNTQIVKHANQHDKNVLKLDLHGKYQKIDNISFVNERGEIFGSNEPLRIQESVQTKDVFEGNRSSKEIDIPVSNVPENSYYIQTSGKDNAGHPFVRLSYVNADPYHNKLPPLTIEVAEGSELIVIPRSTANIYFKVRNNRDQQILVKFHCRDNQRLLRTMNPSWAWLNPRQTVTVAVNVFARPEAGVNYEDIITFSALGYYHAKKVTYFSVSDKIPYDDRSPHMWHRYTRDCMGILLKGCEEENWSIEVTAQDSESGLRIFTSRPEGLIFPNGYTTGTKEPIIGYYSGSCCRPKLKLIAYDLKNNRRSYTADAYRAPLGPGAIAAIVISIILIIVIIAGIIIICKYRKGESGSFNLPNYRSPSRL